jgi:hypothetical protein
LSSFHFRNLDERSSAFHVITEKPRTMLPPLLNKISALLQRRPRQERRVAKRLTPNAMTPCQIRVADDTEPFPALIHNLSKTGVGILSSKDLPQGTLIQIVITNAAHTFALSGAVKVMRNIRVVGGQYLLGGEFTNELQHDELVPFIV